MPLPNLLIIGAQKAGTTALHAMLAQHESVSMSQPKELNFFCWHWERGVDWYADHFENKPVRGDSCPQDAAGWPDVPERIHATIPDVRLVYLVRDPVERIVSAWLHAWTKGTETRPFAELVRSAGFATSAYVARTRYATQVERYLEHFRVEQLLVLCQEDLIANPLDALARVSEHLNMSPMLGIEARRENQSAGRLRPPWAVRALLGARGGWHRETPTWKSRVAHTATARFGRPVSRPEVLPELRARILELLDPELARLEVLTGVRALRSSGVDGCAEPNRTK